MDRSLLVHPVLPPFYIWRYHRTVLVSGKVPHYDIVLYTSCKPQILRRGTLSLPFKHSLSTRIRHCFFSRCPDGFGIANQKVKLLSQGGTKKQKANKIHSGGQPSKVECHDSTSFLWLTRLFPASRKFLRLYYIMPDAILNCYESCISSRTDSCK